MSADKNYILFLTIRDYDKVVPYPGIQHASSRNYGFINVKSKPEEAAKIVEAQDSEALKDAIVRINHADTPFFTIGCEKAFNQKDGIFWTRGFIEFAFNFCELVGDAQAYFPPFFHFNNRLLNTKFDLRVSFEWQLEGNFFKDGNCNGFSCVVWITTGDCLTDGESRKIWETSVRIVADHLAEWKLSRQPVNKIY